MQRAIKNVLIPVNFSASATHAIETGIGMCMRHGATLHLLQVNRDSVMPHPAGRNALLMDLRLQARKNDQDALEWKAKSIAQDYRISCFFHLREGQFAKTVASVAKDFYCDMILLERQIPSSFAGLINTHSAYQILFQTDCPVMVIPARCAKKRFDSILFPISPAQAIGSKLDVSLPIIRENKATVTLIGSTTSRNSISECVHVNNLIQSAHSVISRNTNKVDKELDPTRRTAKKIIRKAIEKSTDLVIISASFKTSLEHLFTGNYTQQMLNTCPVPVLSVR
ncbi:universal stress protein [Daejeonella lutea]|uniref:Nucleotide-binding universal stress protein, UspA family n=1 Tax=Daejeonella lutea TaxID=572036 RepID=A0A1T5AN72_9SPHI|nr:universal stress protein [Daejeonella lutea]SKB36428.1 Nucleotide-binding universal stress protein, UspA family [Daejeonella lutea]